MRILIVEDQVDLLELFATIIAYRKPEALIYTASNGKEALDLIRSHRRSIDIIVCDVIMPVLDGFSLKGILNREGINIPLIFISAIPSIENKLIGKQLGSVGFLSKPITGDDLIEAIDRGIEYSKIVNSEPQMLSPVAELVITQQGHTVVMQLSGDYSIGRTQDSNIRLFSSKCSRETALLSRTQESYSSSKATYHYRIIDISRNGFYLNSKKVEGYSLLKNGDSLTFPGCEMKYFVLQVDQTTEGKDTYV